MTGDARGEAERIVGEFQMIAQAEETREAPGDAWHLGDALVAALAAAIEVDAKNPKPRSDPLIRLKVALSALRARAGEET